MSRYINGISMKRNTKQKNASTFQSGRLNQQHIMSLIQSFAGRIILRIYQILCFHFKGSRNISDNHGFINSFVFDCFSMNVQKKQFDITSKIKNKRCLFWYIFIAKHSILRGDTCFFFVRHSSSKKQFSNPWLDFLFQSSFKKAINKIFIRI